MKTKLNLLIILSLAVTTLFAQQNVQPTKNIIVMIPDGTSLSVLSASRWLKTYRGEGEKLNLDPYLCGTVSTFSSNAPIGDSAPTTSCYMTGFTGQAANISIYPPADPGNDLITLNPENAYQPLATILEAMKMEQGKAAGLVVTCEFPHATPADCASHHYNRNNYEALAPQIAFNNLNVMFGGGNKFVSETMKKHFANTGVTYLQNDKKGMMNFGGDKVWALFGDRELPYDLDRDTTQIPSLAQMTSKALEILNKNSRGFFLMVEGSKVDWAAHANDPAGIMGEFLAFDKAVGAAIEFAKKDGNTTIVILPDHGNSGFSIGRNGLKKSYTKLTLEELFGTVSKIQRTAEGLEKILVQTKPENFKSVFKQYTGIDLTDEELNLLKTSKNYKADDYMHAADAKNLTHNINMLINSRLPFGFTTGGHTGEEVFLAVYHPQGNVPVGNRRNKEVNEYLFRAAGLKTPLAELTANIFAKHTDVFAGMKCSIENTQDKSVKLVVKNKKNTLEIPAFSSVAFLNGKPMDMGSVAVYIDKNNTFYVTKKLAEKVR